MRTALFTNFSNEDFTAAWNGKERTVKAGESKYMPEYLARHFAKHLTNRELLRTDKNGNYIIKDGDKATSPKVKVDKNGNEYVDNVLFNSLFNKAFKLDEEEADQMTQKEDPLDVQIAVANKNRQAREGAAQSSNLPENRSPEKIAKEDGVMTVTAPDFEEDEDSEEEAPKG